MATITPLYEAAGIGGVVVTWANMANGDVGAPATVGSRPDRSVVVTGTFGTGGSVRMQFADRPPEQVPAAGDWQVGTDPSSTDLIFTASKGEQILEHAPQWRPNVTAGDGSTSLTVRMFAYARPR